MPKIAANPFLASFLGDQNEKKLNSFGQVCCCHIWSKAKNQNDDNFFSENREKLKTEKLTCSKNHAPIFEAFLTGCQVTENG